MDSKHSDHHCFVHFFNLLLSNKRKDSWPLFGISSQPFRFNLPSTECFDNVLCEWSNSGCRFLCSWRQYLPLFFVLVNGNGYLLLFCAGLSSKCQYQSICNELSFMLLCCRHHVWLRVKKFSLSHV